MFDSTRQTFGARLTEAVDLLIDFATLGEYGMEPVEDRGGACEARRRDTSGSRRRSSRRRPVGARVA